EGAPEAAAESRELHLGEHLRWEPAFARRVVRESEDGDLLVRLPGGRLALTDAGRESARKAMMV
ncbi:MAG: metal ABC transporter permease, partial [Longimicrobiales bacterium]